jgi:hypothetical protein
MGLFSPPLGFEGGLFTKSDDGTYHLFPSECMADIEGKSWDIVSSGITESPFDSVCTLAYGISSLDK